MNKGPGENRGALQPSAEDPEIGKILSIKDRGGWRAIVVQSVMTSVKSPQGYNQNFYDRRKGEYWRKNHTHRKAYRLDCLDAA